MKMFGYIVAGLAVVIAVYVVGFGLRFGSLQVEGFFAAEKEDIRRTVFENTRSYNQAKLQELANYRFQYLRSKDESEKAAIASTVRLRFSDYQVNEHMPSELNDFWNQINH